MVSVTYFDEDSRSWKHCVVHADVATVKAAPELLAALKLILKDAQIYDVSTGFFKPLDPYEAAAICHSAIASATKQEK